MMKHKHFALFLALLLLLGSLAGCGNPAASEDNESNTVNRASGKEESGTGLQVGQQAPDFTLTLMDGSQVRLSQLQGKPVLLNFFTTWCGPCQAEMPDIQAIYEKYEGQAHVLGVSSGESLDLVKATYQDSDYRYPMAADPDGAVSQVYDIQFIPQTWVLNAQGIIVDYVGHAEGMAYFEAALQKAGLQ